MPLPLSSLVGNVGPGRAGNLDGPADHFEACEGIVEDMTEFGKLLGEAEPGND